jgi:hypothetical protein
MKLSAGAVAGAIIGYQLTAHCAQWRLIMSEKTRRKKDGEDKNKNNQREREANKDKVKSQAAQDESGRNPNYK